MSWVSRGEDGNQEIKENNETHEDKHKHKENADYALAFQVLKVEIAKHPAKESEERCRERHKLRNGEESEANRGKENDCEE